MKILLLGGGGYLGSELAITLSRYNHKVTVLDSFIYTTEAVFESNTHISIINQNISKYNNFLDINDFDIVFYMVSTRLYDTTEESIVEHLSYLENVLDDINDSTKLFFMSSCSVYGISDNIVDESSQSMVTSLYSKLKIESENLIKEKIKNYHILRLSTLYGNSRGFRYDIFINSILDESLHDKKISIFDKTSIRPHLHINDCIDILSKLCETEIDSRILNIGFNELNISKENLIHLVENIIENLDVEYIDSNDIRNYQVNFDLLKSILDINYTPYIDGISDTISAIQNKVIFCVEEWDTILDYYRPTCSSKTWYYLEEGRFSIPKSYGVWNLLDIEDNYRMFDRNNIKESITPMYDRALISFLEYHQIPKNKKYAYVINAYNFDFFKTNRNIGFSVMRDEILDDVRSDRCKIYILCPYEGFSGMKGNDDVDIIEKWCSDSDIPFKNVNYIHGNVLESKRKIKIHGVSIFDTWVDKSLIDYHVDYGKEDKKLFLSYNRRIRESRLYLIDRLIEFDLLKDGLVSLSEFPLNSFNYKYFDVRRVNDVAPLSLNSDLNINLATTVDVSDFNDSFISVVTETLVEDGTLFLSEKTWKPIVIGHPFMIIGSRGTLKYLKSLGFKTFDKWWDESYDDIYSWKERLNMIVSQLVKLRDEISLDMLMEMRDVIIHNKNNFKKLYTEKYYNSISNSINERNQIYNIINLDING